MGPAMSPGQIPLLSLHEAHFGLQLQAGSPLPGRPRALDSLFLYDSTSTLQKVQHSLKKNIYIFLNSL